MEVLKQVSFEGAFRVDFVQSVTSAFLFWGDYLMW